MTATQVRLKPSDVSEQSINLGFGYSPELEDGDYKTLALWMLQYLTEWEGDEFCEFSLANFKLYVGDRMPASTFAKIGDMVVDGYLGVRDELDGTVIIIDRLLIEYFEGHSGS